MRPSSAAPLSLSDGAARHERGTAAAHPAGEPTPPPSKVPPKDLSEREDTGEQEGVGLQSGGRDGDVGRRVLQRLRRAGPWRPAHRVLDADAPARPHGLY